MFLFDFVLVADFVAVQAVVPERSLFPEILQFLAVTCNTSANAVVTNMLNAIITVSTNDIFFILLFITFSFLGTFSSPRVNFAPLPGPWESPLSLS